MSLALLYFGLFVVFHLGSASQIVVVNRCPEIIWPAIHGRDLQPIQGQGFVTFDELPSSGLYTNQTWVTSVPEGRNVSGRLWPRTGCQKDGEKWHCRTGDCGGYSTCLNATADNTTLVEFNFEKTLVYYDISLGKSKLLSANSLKLMISSRRFYYTD